MTDKSKKKSLINPLSTPISRFRPKCRNSKLKHKLGLNQTTSNKHIQNVFVTTVKNSGNCIPTTSSILNTKDPSLCLGNCTVDMERGPVPVPLQDVSPKPSIVKMPSRNHDTPISGIRNCFKSKPYKSKIDSINSLLPAGCNVGSGSSLKVNNGEIVLPEKSNHSKLYKEKSNIIKLHKHPLVNKGDKLPHGSQRIKSNIVDQQNLDKKYTTLNPNMDESSLGVASENISGSNISVHQLSILNCIIVMKPESCLYFVGIIQIEVLRGTVEILGFNVNCNSNVPLIYSLQGSSHLFVKAKHTSTTDKGNVTHEKFISLGLSSEKANQLLQNSKDCTYLIVNRNKTHISSSVWPTFFRNHSSFSIFPPNDLLCQETRPHHSVERIMECLFEENLKEIGLKEFRQIPEWSEIEEIVLSQGKVTPKTVLCGGKSVGKSTFLRFLANKYVQKWGSVLVLDFDLGQCEFTLPGCISATLVNEPVFGPNFSHLKEPLRSVFLGEVDVTKCPEHYIDGCRLLIKYASEHHANIPWLVNTMGFTKGFGVTLICGIIKTLNPTYVIQIESKDWKLNFPSQLQPGFVYSQNVDAFAAPPQSLDYKLFIMPSGSELQGYKSQKTRGISPAEARNLVILSYLSEMLTSEKLHLSEVTPYKIKMDVIDLQTTDKYSLSKEQVAAAMNGNLVALCHTEPGYVVPNCHGFGIVRGIDWKDGIMFVITPVPAHTLRKINCIVKGNIPLPESLYYNQGPKITGHVPYLSHTSGRYTSRFARRDFRSLPTTPRQEK